MKISTGNWNYHQYRLLFLSSGVQNKHFPSNIPISFFCNTSCAKVHRRPLRNDADKTRRNPVMWNCVDWYVNKNNPIAMKSTTNISEHFWKKRKINILLFYGTKTSRLKYYASSVIYLTIFSNLNNRENPSIKTITVDLVIVYLKLEV